MGNISSEYMPINNSRLPGSFKNKYTFEERIAWSKKQVYGKSITIICETEESVNMRNTSFKLQPHVPLHEFYDYIHSKMKLGNKQITFYHNSISINNRLNNRIDLIYERLKDEDGILYLTFTID